MVEVQSPIARHRTPVPMGKTSWDRFICGPMERGTDERPAAAYMSHAHDPRNLSQSSDTFRFFELSSSSTDVPLTDPRCGRSHLPTEEIAQSSRICRTRAAVAVVTGVGWKR